MKNFAIAAAIVAALLLLIRFVPSKDEMENSKADGYITTVTDIKKQAERSLQESVAKENNRLNETTMENQGTPLTDKYTRAVIKTSMGDVAVDFFTNKSPKTVENFLKLSSDGFYNGTAFHRIIKGFMIQGGDPLSKESDWSKVSVGTGGPGYQFADEINNESLVRGSLAMANSGPNTNGSQFFIVTAPETPWLDGKHTNFGKVVSGMDVVEKIENAKTNQTDQPLEKITINSIELLEK